MIINRDKFYDELCIVHDIILDAIDSYGDKDCEMLTKRASDKLVKLIRNHIKGTGVLRKKMCNGFVGKDKERFLIDFEKKTFEVYRGSGDSLQVHAENVSDELCNLIEQLWDRYYKLELEFERFVEDLDLDNLTLKTVCKLVKTADKYGYDWSFLDE